MNHLIFMIPHFYQLKLIRIWMNNVTALGHRLHRRRAVLQVPGDGLPDARDERPLGNPCGNRRRLVRGDRRGERALGQARRRQQCRSVARPDAEAATDRRRRLLWRCRDLEAAGHVCPGDDLFHGLRPLLLRQLEISRAALAHGVSIHGTRPRWA